ncbi:sensor histidine kinase [Patescibacteria group bacterium]
MKFFSRSNLLFLKKNYQIVYATLLLFLIPAAVILNSFFFIKSTQKIIDVEINREAHLAEQVFVASFDEDTLDAELIQERIQKIASLSEAIYGLDVLIPVEEDYQVIASLDSNAVGKVSTFLNYTIAWKTEEGISYTTRSDGVSPSLEGTEPDRGDDRYWIVASPLYNSEGEKIALVSMKISSQVIDERVAQTLNQSVLILVVIVIIIILLLATNTRLFEYAMLFRKLKEVDKMKDEFISVASHELRTPITGIQGYLSMILKNEFGEVPGEIKDKLQLMQGATKQLNELVEDLLNVSRIQQGRIKVQPVSYDVRTTLREVVQSLKAKADEKELTCVFEEPQELPNAMCDPDRLRQIMMNLVGNAIKYTPKGSIRVTAEVKDKMIEIKTIDTGMGMSGKDREHLFEKFYRIRNTETASIVGTGLGLWITRELVQLMKGNMYVDSIEHVGTQVAVLIPLAGQKK